MIHNIVIEIIHKMVIWSYDLMVLDSILFISVLFSDTWIDYDFMIFTTVN